MSILWTIIIGFIRLSSLGFRSADRLVEELRGAAVIEPNFIATTVSDCFVLPEVYIGHAPMMPWM
jgi:hypothetical protein